MLIAEGFFRRLISVRPERATVPLVVDTRRWASDSVREYLMRFPCEDVWFRLALLGELAGSALSVRESAETRELIDAAAEGIATGVIKIAFPLPADPRVYFNQDRPRSRPFDIVLFAGFRVAERFVGELRGAASAALRSALRHPAAGPSRQRRRVPTEAEAQSRAGQATPYGDWTRDQLAELLASDQLILLPSGVDAATLRLAWAAGGGGVGELEDPGTAAPQPTARVPRQPRPRPAPAPALAGTSPSPAPPRPANPPQPPAPPPPAPPPAPPPPPPAAPTPPPAPVKPPVDPLWVRPVINPEKLIVVVPKTYTKPRRQRFTLTTDSAFDGTGTMTVQGPAGAKFFDAETAGNQVAAGGSQDFPGAPLTAGIPLWAEGVTASTAMDDLVVTLSLAGGSKQRRPPVKMTITVVELQLDICMSRAVVGGDRTPLSQSDKITVGRYLHRQIDRMHGRARLLVGPVKPASFTGTLTLAPITAGGSGTVILYGAADDIPAAGQTPLANPYDFPATTVGTGLNFFVEGTRTSGALRDTGWRLGVKDIEPDGDHVAITVVEFSNLVAKVPTTPARTVRLNNATTPAESTLTIASSGGNFEDFSDTLSNPLLLIENAVPGNTPVKLSVQVQPAGVPVLWSVRRDTRPAPQGDNPAILTLTPAPNARPTLTPAAGNPLAATLTADSVGCFHVCPYVDCNANATQDFNDPTSGAMIDREPLIVLGLVLIRVQSFSNSSRGQTANSKVLQFSGAAQPPTSATGVAYRSGTFAGPTAAAVHNDAVVTVIGGGRTGTFGLDRLFAGWVNNVTAMNAVSHYVQPATATTPEATHDVTAIMASNTVAVTAGTVNAGNVLTLFIPPSTTLPGHRPRSTTAPVSAPPPALDVSPFADAGTGGCTCIGTEGVSAARPTIAIVKTPLPTATHALALGEDWRVQMYDSPGFNASPRHPVVHAAVLRAFSFNVDFSCDLCFWTNLGYTPNATDDPAARLYSVAQSNTWRVRFDISFAPTAPGAGTIGQQATQMTIDPVTVQLAKTAAAAGVEVRFPTALALWAQDATT